MRRFERRVADGGGQQADRHAAGAGRSPERVSASQSRREVHSPWLSSSGLRLLSGSTQVQILSGGLLEVKPDKRAGTRLKRTGRRRRWGAYPFASAIFLESKTAKREKSALQIS